MFTRETQIALALTVAATLAAGGLGLLGLGVPVAASGVGLLVLAVVLLLVHARGALPPDPGGGA